MTAKNRNKSGEKSGQDDASKKSHNSGDSGPQEPRRSWSCLGFFFNTLFYLGLLGAAGFAALHLQTVVEEMRQTSALQEESARRSAELDSKLESVVQQLESVKSFTDGLESSLRITRVELEAAVSRMKRGEVETRRVEEALQKLQNDLLRDLSEGISEVKEAREKDFSSLEKTVEERLAEASQSIKASVAEFTEAQGETQSQLADLKSRLDDMEDPALIKQELSAIVETVAEIKVASDADNTMANSLREQIGSVRAELQTRNQEVVSLSQEVEMVRSVMQDTVGSLKQSLSAAEAEVQALKDKSVSLEASVEQAAEAAHDTERQAHEATAQVKKQADELEARVKASEDGGDSLSALVSDISGRVDSLLTKYGIHESTLSAQAEAVEKVKSSVEQELEELKASLEALGSTLKDSHQMEDLEKRLAALEGSSGSSVRQEQLQSLTSMVAGLEAKATKLEGHDKAISNLQKALKETTRTLAGLSKIKAKK